MSDIGNGILVHLADLSTNLLLKSYCELRTNLTIHLLPKYSYRSLSAELLNVEKQNA